MRIPHCRRIFKNWMHKAEIGNSSNFLEHLERFHLKRFNIWDALEVMLVIWDS